MSIERFEIPGLAQYSYLIIDQGHAVVIDPIRDIERYLSFISIHNLKLTHVLETHIHADFVSGSTALAGVTGAQLALSAYDRNEHYRYGMPHRELKNGETLAIGSLQLETLHTPGHTPEHLSFMLFDSARSSIVAEALFSGDFLFAGSVGRPDLLGENAKLALTGELYRSMHQRIAHLPDSLQLLPGHGAGSLCGAGTSERGESTLGYERATNPLFSLSQDAFIQSVVASVPSMPAYYPRIKVLNAAGASLLAESADLNAISAQQLLRDLHAGKDFIVLDLRLPEKFASAFIPGAINIGAGQNLSLWAGWLLKPAQQIILVAESSCDAVTYCESRNALARVGLDHVLGYLDGGMQAWIGAGYQTESMNQASAQEVNSRTPETLILDVRAENEWARGHIPHAVHLMLGDLPQYMETLQLDRKIVTVCASGYRSSIAASMLLRHGCSKACSMAGGMAYWNRQGLPLCP